MKRLQKSYLAAFVTAFTLCSAPIAQADYLINDDLIVDGSECAGNDCVSGEAFGFDTLRFRENNLRIHFDDTSSIQNYPRNDWRITINDSTDGGANYFAIDDITGETTPFKIEAGAPNSSLYVDSHGDVGINTSTPYYELHIVDGDSPTVRLEQDGSYGWTPQKWDLAGNESNFFIRDATHASKLPFRIEPNASTDSLFISHDSEVGIGTGSPNAKLHVQDTSGSAKILVEELNGSTEGRVLFQLANNGQPWFAFNDSSTGNEFRMGMNAGGDFLISAPGTGGQELNLSNQGELSIRSLGSLIFDLASSGDLAVAGTDTTGSSRTIKKDFEKVDSIEVLKRLDDVEILKWSYKRDEAAYRHMSPMAEDFYAAFQLGADDKHLAPGDAAGVALAAIKGLQQQLKDKDKQIAELLSRVQKLEEQFSK